MNKKTILLIILVAIISFVSGIVVKNVFEMVKLKTRTDTRIVNDVNRITNNEKPDQEKIESKEYIGKEKAKEIALKKANLKSSDVTFIKVESDMEKGIYIYEIEFRKDNREYSADIKADDGTILDWEEDFDN